MLKVKVIAIGKCKEDWLRLALSEYEKRLSPVLEIQWIQPKDDLDLIERLAQEERFIALDPKGELMDSGQFSKNIIRFFEQNYSRATFAIGGPDGFPPNLITKSTLCWSLSSLTFTHQLTRLVLVEQIYRAMEIAKNSPYHRGNCKTTDLRKIDDFEPVCQGRHAAQTPPPKSYSGE